MAGEKREKQKIKSKVSISHILGGGILTEDFFVRQSGLLLLIAGLCIVFIANRYGCLKQISEVEKLSRELNDVKYESLVISTELTTNSRQSQIESLIEQRNLGLTGSKTPPFELK
jgi:hypothetical protein